MVNPLLKVGKTALVKGGKVLADVVAPGVVDLGAKIGNELLEKHKNLIKIPNLKDVLIDEALRILKDEYNLVPTPAIASPRIAYADESENEVMYAEPKFGSKVDPKTTVKVYYLTQDVINKSKELLEKQAKDCTLPKVVGLSIGEAVEDLEAVGLKVTRRLEKPNLKLVDKEDGEVTRLAYPDNKKVGAKFKAGERLVVYYVNEEVISECKAMKDKKIQDDQERIERFKKAAMDMKDGIQAGAMDQAQKVGEMIKKPLAKKKDSSKKDVE